MFRCGFVLLSLWWALGTPQLVQAAVHLSDDGSAEVMIFPFYSVSNDLNTYISINNTTDQAKAVKVHIKEAKFSAAVMSFNIYLAPQDMWAAAIGQQAGVLQLFTADNSCTPFSPHFIGDTLNTDPEWDWEIGTIEVFEMGTVMTGENGFFDDSDADNNCQLISQAWDETNPDSLWQQTPTAQMGVATGGLTGDVAIIDVVNGTMFNYQPILLNGFYPPDTIIHTEPTAPFPDLSHSTQTSLLIKAGSAIETTWPTGYEAISALLTKASLENDFNQEDVVAAVTEWVFTFPTLHYHLADTDLGGLPFTNSSDRFTFPFRLDFGVELFDREGQLYPYYYPCGISAPCPPELPRQLTHTVNVMYVSSNNRFPSTSVLAGTFRDNVYRFKRNNPPDTLYPIENGKLKMRLADPTDQLSPVNSRGVDSTTQQPHHYHGIPVVGFAFTSFKNAAAQPGLLATYATARTHQGNRLLLTEAQPSETQN